MTMNDYPRPGEHWRLKHNPDRVAVVLAVDEPGSYPWGGYVELRAWWTKNGIANKTMDTFLKQYEPASPNPTEKDNG